MQPLINIIQENNWVITTKKGKSKLPLFCGNGEPVITIYDRKADSLEMVMSSSRVDGGRDENEAPLQNDNHNYLEYKEEQEDVHSDQE